MARGQRWFSEPPWWAWLVMVACAIFLAVGTPIALGRGQVSSAETERPSAPAGTQPPALPVAAFLGDSYTAGTGGGEYVNQASAALGWRPINFGAPGTGYLNPGEEERGTFADRLPDVIAAGPAIVVVQGSLNDAGSPAGKVGEAASEVFASLRRGLPEARIIVVGPEDPPGTDPAQIEVLRAELAAAASGAGLPWIDPVSEGWLPDDRDYADGLHPTGSGFRAYSERMVADVKALG